MIFRKLKEKKKINNLRMTLGILREIELRAEDFSDLEELDNNINALRDARDTFAEKYVESEDFWNKPKDERFILINQLEGMTTSILKLMRLRHSVAKVLNKEDGTQNKYC